jgi:hypothetical protein
LTPPGIQPGGRRGLRQLQRAHQWMEQGMYKQAADLFSRLAQAAERRALPRTPQLYFQAGRARILKGATEVGMQNLYKGAEILATAGRWEILARASNRLTQELRGLGLEHEASVWSQKLEKLAGANLKSLSQRETKSKPTLPVKCPQCGGTIHPGEVDWLDTDRVLCSYCGSVVSGER